MKLVFWSVARERASSAFDLREVLLGNGLFTYESARMSCIHFTRNVVALHSFHKECGRSAFINQSSDPSIAITPGIRCVLHGLFDRENHASDLQWDKCEQTGNTAWVRVQKVLSLVQKGPSWLLERVVIYRVNPSTKRICSLSRATCSTDICSSCVFAPTTQFNNVLVD